MTLTGGRTQASRQESARRRQHGQSGRQKRQATRPQTHRKTEHTRGTHWVSRSVTTTVRKRKVALDSGATVTCGGTGVAHTATKNSGPATDRPRGRTQKGMDRTAQLDLARRCGDAREHKRTRRTARKLRHQRLACRHHAACETHTNQLSFARSQQVPNGRINLCWGRCRSGRQCPPRSSSR